MQELITGLLADRPDLAAYPEAVAAWADSEVRAWLMRNWLEEQGMLAKEGIAEAAEGVLKWLAAFDRRAADGRARLGLDPMSEWQLAKVRADAAHSMVDLDALRATGAKILEAREAEDAAEADDAGEAAS